MSTNFLAELKRRNVLRMGGLYLVGAWLIAQVAGTLLPMFDAPAWVARTIVMMLALGLIPALIFAWVYELTPEGIRRERDVDPDASIMPETGRRMDRAIFVLLLLAVVIFALDRFVLVPRREAAALVAVAPAPAAPPAAAASPAIPEASIAVLPLANGGGDKDQQFFSDGLSENLIVALSQFDGLTVIGRNSAFQFRDSKEDSKSIGTKLRVAHLLEGSVQRAGDVVRISAELIDAASGRALWSQRYDRPYKDLFALQDEITGAVATALKAKLLSGAPALARNDRPPSGSLEAYTAYLQGKFYAARSSEADFRTAIQQYATATRLDARYALAWAELSRAWSGLASQHLEGVAAQDAYAQARSAVATALQLDPDLAAAHWARGFFLLSSDFDWNGGDAEIRRAQQLAPNDGRAKFELAKIMAMLGKDGDAVALTREALATDPLEARWHGWLANFLAAAGRLDEARQANLKAIELQPGAVANHYQLAIVEVLRNDAPAALAAAQAEPEGSWRDIALGIARQIGTDRAAADAALKMLIDRHSLLAPFQIAEVYAVRKDADKLFEWLERAWSARDPGIQYLLSDPLLRPYQHDPRFAEFCRKVRLPAPGSAASKAAT